MELWSRQFPLGDDDKKGSSSELYRTPVYRVPARAKLRRGFIYLNSRFACSFVSCKNEGMYYTGFVLFGNVSWATGNRLCSEKLNYFFVGGVTDPITIGLATALFIERKKGDVRTQNIIWLVILQTLCCPVAVDYKQFFDECFLFNTELELLHRTKRFHLLKWSKLPFD